MKRERANAEIRATFEAEGIHPEFGPSVNFQWWQRGENMAKERRAELRSLYHARTEADYKGVCHEIEKASVEIQTRLVEEGLTTERARAFLAAMPDVHAALAPMTEIEIRSLMNGRKGQHLLASVEDRRQTQ